MYDYGARFYDPAVGRWFTPDALAEKYYNQSTYTYALNNPIIYIDPDGNQVEMCCQGLKDFVKGISDAGAAFNAKAISYGKQLVNSPAKTLLKTGNDMAIGTAQLVHDVIPGLSLVSGIENKTGKAMMGAIDKVADIPNMTSREAGATFGAGLLVVGEMVLSKKVPSIKTQAKAIKNTLNNGKNSVNVGTVDGVNHYDLEGATHKGVDTPHVQTSTKNTNSAGETFVNKNRKDVRPMNQQDIRNIRKVLKKRNENNGS